MLSDQELTDRCNKIRVETERLLNDKPIDRVVEMDKHIRPSTITSDHVQELSPNQQQVVEYLRIHPRQTNKEISEGLDKDKATISKVLKSLVDVVVKNGDEYELKPSLTILSKDMKQALS